MRLKIIIIIAALLMCADIYAQNNIAIYVVSDNDTPAAYKKVVGTNLTEAVNTDGHFVAVERTNEFLSAIGSEMAYQNSGAVSQSKIIELGRQYGANYVFVVDLSNVLGELYASSRIINVGQNIIESVSEESARISNLETLKTLSKRIATNTLAKLPYNVAKKRTKNAQTLLAGYTEHTIWGASELYRAYNSYNNISKDAALKIVEAKKELGQPIRYPVIYAIEYYDRNSTKKHDYIRLKFYAIGEGGTSYYRLYTVTHSKDYGTSTGANIGGSMFTR